MSSAREALTRLLYQHEKTGRSCIGCRACPDLEFMNSHQHAEHVADVIASELLMVPHSDITDTAYGYSFIGTDGERQTWAANSEADAAHVVDAMRSRGADAHLVSRPILPIPAWTRLPEEVNGDD